MQPTGPLSFPGLAFTAILAMIALFAMRRHRDRLAGSFAAFAIGVTAISTVQTQPKPFAHQPFPDAPEVADVTWRMTHGQGYTTTLHTAEPRPPRYAPGFPLALAPFALFGGEFPACVELGAAFYAGFYVVAVSLAAWAMGGPTAAAIAALIMGVSPFARDMAMMVMSDAFAAALTLLLIPLICRPSSKRALCAGAIAGSLVAVRLPMILNLPALLIALPRSLWSRAIAAAAVPLGAYAFFNYMTYGGPLTTGYDLWVVNIKNFSMRYPLRHLMGEGPWVTPDALGGELILLFAGRTASQWPIGGPQNGLSNLVFYPTLLNGLFWVFNPPLVSTLGLLGCIRTRYRPESRFALSLCVLSLVFFCFYFHQGTRFMAAPASVLLAVAAARFAYWTGSSTAESTRQETHEGDLERTEAVARTSPRIRQSSGELMRPSFAKAIFARRRMTVDTIDQDSIEQTRARSNVAGH